MKRLTAIQKSACNEECTLRIPGICNGNPETVVLCHAPYPGRSGMRTHDWWAAYGCSSCHAYMDAYEHVDMPYSGGEDGWMPAIHETQSKLLQKGLIWLGENPQSVGSKICKRSPK